MSSAQRRDRERDQLRRAILDATLELFSTEDFEKVSMRRIAEKVEYSATAIYLHFKDKGALLDALAAEGFARLADALVAVPGDDPADRLRQMGYTYVALALGNRPAYRLMFYFGHTKNLYEGHVERRPSGGRAFEAIVNAVRNVAGVAEKAEDPDAVPDAEAMAAGVLWAHIHGAVSLVLSGRGRRFTDVGEQFCRQAVDTAVAGLLAGSITRPPA